MLSEDQRQRLVEEVVTQVFMLIGQVKAHFDEQANTLGLTPMQARALHHIEGHTLTMGMVADRLHCDASNVTGIIDRLEEQGLVGRYQDPDDRRRKRLLVTPEGREMLDDLKVQIAHNHPITRLDSQQLPALRDLLDVALTSPG